MDGRGELQQPRVLQAQEHLNRMSGVFSKGGVSSDRGSIQQQLVSNNLDRFKVHRATRSVFRRSQTCLENAVAQIEHHSHCTLIRKFMITFYAVRKEGRAQVRILPKTTECGALGNGVLGEDTHSCFLLRISRLRESVFTP